MLKEESINSLEIKHFRCRDVAKWVNEDLLRETVVERGKGNSVECIRLWLIKCGCKLEPYKTSMAVDGHERLDVIKQRERSLEVSHQLNLNNEKEKSENIFQSELKPLEDKESEVDKIMNLSARGAFTDFKWNKSDFEHQMTLLDEVLKVMFKGDELKEARVIIHTLIEKYGMNVGISQRGLRDMVEAVELNKSKEDSIKAFKEFVRDWANEIEESIRFMSYR